MEGSNNKNSKIIKYPRGIHMPLIVVIFLVILIYLVISIIGYLGRKHIVGYEVKAGSLSADNIYEAIALRQEEIMYSDSAGYVNYFATEGRRVAVGNLVYTIDSSGRLIDYLNAEAADSISLSSENLGELRTQIATFAESFDKDHFRTVYDFKIGLDGTVQKLSNNSILQNIRSLNEGDILSAINYKNAIKTGVILYSTDGFEDLAFDQISRDTFEQDGYVKTQLVGNALVESGDPVYKLVTSENWSVVIPVESAERAQEMLDMEYVKVRFLKNQNEAWGKVETRQDEKGDSFVQLSFNNSMSSFCTDRFLNIEIILNDDKGLKIPNSAIVEKSFYLVPVDYLTSSNGKEGVLRQTYLEDGTESTEFVECSVYNITETDVYLDQTALRNGDRLTKPGSATTYTVSRLESMIGVYNINKGYADFRRIRILYQNDEYSIVAPNTTYGLSVYDFIVLDTSTVTENELIYE